ncbi:hypothetical protein DW757_16395 [Clostridium sp. AM29-11AC]|uniref:hypothetical protein n=1 Tax=Clostridium sp. AM29-11AC TaxID=2293028 RepID=UPI000E4A89D8|nr:hypothetical protein [Clostridium sp. AM29-11AC]RHT55069.1 hypothetical protein DW757_16395 [Clostridium sp. AM29-11AC]
MKNRNRMFVPEDANEEALMLMGRVEALAAYVCLEKYSIEREVVAAILGFDLEPETNCGVTEIKRKTDGEETENEPLPL